jgi:hypothetical protein
LSIPQTVWSEPWGCTNPFPVDNVLLLGHHVFKAYLVVHDMSSHVYRMGFGKVDRNYTESIGKVETTKVPTQGSVRHCLTPNPKNIFAGGGTA